MLDKLVVLLMAVVYAATAVCGQPGGPIGAAIYFKYWVKNKIRGLS